MRPLIWFVRFRDAITGLFISPAEFDARPRDETLAERRRRKRR